MEGFNSILLTVIIALLGFIWKTMRDAIKEITTQLNHHKTRHDVSDSVISSLIKESFSSELIAKKGTPWPRMRDS